MDQRAQGVLLITLSAIAFSSAGFFTRLIHLDAWTMLFWRGLFASLIILCVIVAQERPRTVAAIRAIGRPGLIVALCSTAATILYINALRHTSVADVAVIFATAPFITAGLGWILLGIKEPWATLIASLAVLLGVGIVVGGAAAEGRLVGDVLAFVMTVCVAVMTLIMRRQRHTPMLPAACLSALLCPLVVWPFTPSLATGVEDMVNLFLFGTGQFGIGLILLTLGSRLISATENALITTLETPRAVAWVWLLFGETPSGASLTGGTIVMAAVAVHVWQARTNATAKPNGETPSRPAWRQAGIVHLDRQDLAVSRGNRISVSE
jgi:drug/metabolite transporter (DMT)-like permease